MINTHRDSNNACSVTLRIPAINKNKLISISFAFIFVILSFKIWGLEWTHISQLINIAIYANLNELYSAKLYLSGSAFD